MEVINIPGFDIDFKNWTFSNSSSANRTSTGFKLVNQWQDELGGMDALPPDALNAIQSVADHLKTVIKGRRKLHPPERSASVGKAMVLNKIFERSLSNG